MATTTGSDDSGPSELPIGSASKQQCQSREGHFSGQAGHSNHPHLFALKVRLVHTKNSWGKLTNIFNRNHRHDEAHEQEIDGRREEVARSHRYGSFAPVTVGNTVKWYVDGRDYFWAVSVALESAREVIYIEDWWLSPELFLRRPPTENREWRLDRVLRRKAQQGVKIFVIVYKEISQALTCNSAHTKAALEQLCPHGHAGHGNIYVMRHPDHDPFLHGADMTFYWVCNLPSPSVPMPPSLVAVAVRGADGGTGAPREVSRHRPQGGLCGRAGPVLRPLGHAPASARRHPPAGGLQRDLARPGVC